MSKLLHPHKNRIAICGWVEQVTLLFYLNFLKSHHQSGQNGKFGLVLFTNIIIIVVINIWFFAQHRQHPATRSAAKTRGNRLIGPPGHI
jgi:hypothetical protein